MTCKCLNVCKMTSTLHGISYHHHVYVLTLLTSVDIATGMVGA